jgi:hypothetical protein
MNRLKGSMCYVAGNIDGLADSGTTWREEITPFLHSLGITVINPCDKPTSLVHALEDEDVEFHKKKKHLKANGKYDDLKAIMKPICRADLKFVNKADFLFVCLDVDKRPCGTIWEMCIANLLRIPIIIICRQGKNQLSDWLYGLLPHNLFFDTFDEAKDYLVHINSAESLDDLTGRWKLFDYNTRN